MVVKELTCKRCSNFMYFVPQAKAGIDYNHTPWHEGLIVAVVCDGCGEERDAVFLFGRFSDEPITEEETGFLASRSARVAHRLEGDKNG